MMNAYYSNPRPEMLAYLPPDTKTCLDVGCGAGDFAASIKQRLPGTEVWGIEIIEDAGQKARQKIDRAIIASAEDALDQLPDSYFDCVFFNDSLEHFVDPFSYLAAIRRKLKPGATVVASIPNMRHYKVLFGLLVRNDWRYTDAGVLDRTHLRFFTIKSMRRLFEEAGFSVIKQEGLNGSRKLKVRLWGWFTLGALEDIRFAQFVVVAQNGRP